MAASLILHIGANKTGSSAVQTFLRLNHASLRAADVLVPDKELGTSNKITGEHVFAFQQLLSHEKRAELASKLNLLVNAGSSRVVCSAENLSNGAHYQYFAKALQQVDCKVILYIRRQDELLTSSWQQWSSKREVDFEAWLVLALQRLGHWQRCIDGWEATVGPGNVIVRIFQKSDLRNGDVVDDFIECAQLSEPSDGFKRSTDIVNPSYSDLITPIVSGNEFIFSSEHDNRFYSLVGNLTGSHYVSQKRVSLISKAQREKIVEFYRQQNEHICKRYFPNRPRLFDPVNHDKYDYLTSEELVRRQLGFLCSLMFALAKRDE